MAITYQLIDDIDHTTPNAQTVQFALNGQTWTIDLAEANLARLQEALAPYIAAAQKAPRPSGVKPQKRAPGVAPQTRAALHAVAPLPTPSMEPKAIRAWAVEQGLAVTERGRIPAQITEQYLAAVK